LQLEKKFIFNWAGFWSTIDTNKNGIVKNIDVFDINDFDYISENIKNELKKKEVKKK